MITMDDFYFVYDYDKKNNTASRICRLKNAQFQQFNKETKVWENNNELSCILMGEDIFYDEITEDEVNKIINNL